MHIIATLYDGDEASQGFKFKNENVTQKSVIFHLSEMFDSKVTAKIITF